MPQADSLSFQVLEGWEQLPAGWRHLDVVGVAVDSKDQVFIYTRDEPRVIVYSRDGRFIRSWGEGFFTARTHGITIGPDDSVYCVDEGAHVVYKFTPDGKLLSTIGVKGVASDTGYDGSSVGSIKRAGPPFNRPTNLAVAPNDELYVSDGYGNARVHRFSADGKLIQSWGEPGMGEGQFNLPHGIFVDSDGRVMVADRENDRIQIFTPDGKFIEQWDDVQRPTNIYIGPDGNVYVSELWWRVGQKSFKQGQITTNQPSRVSVFNRKGKLLHRFGGDDPCAAGNFCAAHDICVDSKGDVYVTEVTYTFAVRNGVVPEDCHTFQKFALKG